MWKLKDDEEDSRSFQSTESETNDEDSEVLSKSQRKSSKQHPSKASTLPPQRPELITVDSQSQPNVSTSSGNLRR